MSNTSGLDIWGVISGAHPETKLAQLDSTLKDTENLLRSVVEEGLLDPDLHVTHFDLQLNKFRRTAEQYRDETFIASNEWRKLLEAWYNGLSKRIALLCKEVRDETSANARMQLMEQSREVVVPTHRVWRAKVVRLWHRVVSLVFKGTHHDTVDAPTSASVNSATSTVNEVDPPTRDATLSSVEAQTVLSARGILLSASSPSLGKNRKSTPSPTTVRTALGDHDLRVLTRAIQRLGRELAAQGVTNTLLTQLVQATHRQWAPGSSKAHSPRRPRKQRSVSVANRLERASTQTTLQGASESGIDIDCDDDLSESGEDTVCSED